MSSKLAILIGIIIIVGITLFGIYRMISVIRKIIKKEYKEDDAQSCLRIIINFIGIIICGLGLILHYGFNFDFMSKIVLAFLISGGILVAFGSMLIPRNFRDLTESILENIFNKKEGDSHLSEILKINVFKKGNKELKIFLLRILMILLGSITIFLSIFINIIYLRILFIIFSPFLIICSYFFLYLNDTVVIENKGNINK